MWLHLGFGICEAHPDAHEKRGWPAVIRSSERMSERANAKLWAYDVDYRLVPPAGEPPAGGTRVG